MYYVDKSTRRTCIMMILSTIIIVSFAQGDDGDPGPVGPPGMPGDPGLTGKPGQQVS